MEPGHRVSLILALLAGSLTIVASSSKGDTPSGGSLRQMERKILDQILSPTNYDSNIRPWGANTTGKETDGPTQVMVNLFVRSLDKLEDAKQEYGVQITFRQQWNDNRLAFSDQDGKIKFLTLTDKSKVWTPDTFFRNAKEATFHDVIQPNHYVRIFPNGDTLYSTRVSLTLSCPMDLKLFPMDSQTCRISFASYAWTTKDLIYVWQSPNPVQIGPQLFSPEGFVLNRYIEENCDVTTATGQYSCLSVVMQFKRQMSYYMLTIYLPTFLIVSISWMGFWLDHKSSQARMVLTITTVLAMGIAVSSVSTALPSVAYTKAADVWLNLCLSFVFFTLAEYALVNILPKTSEKPVDELGREQDTTVTSAFKRYLPRAETMDKMSRILFPVAFAGVSVVYWSYYLSKAAANE